jgi:membrane-associated PAP2 superfamily phosphatase
MVIPPLLAVRSSVLRQNLTIQKENVVLNEEPRMSETHLHRSEDALSRRVTDDNKGLLLQTFLLLSFVSIVFAAVPALDLIASRYFWDPSSGFALQNNGALIVFRDVIGFLPWVVIGLAAALFIPNSILGRFVQPPAPHKLLFVMAFIGAGPGLSVPLIKMLVARARPRDLIEFGGNALFTPPWQFTNQCTNDCSFISGESASAVALLTLVVLIRPKYSITYLMGINIMAVAISFASIATVAHFLSDVVIAWNVMLSIAVLLWGICSRNAQQIDAMVSRR